MNKSRPKVASPGSWTSPLTPDSMVKKANSPTGVFTLDNKVYVLESRPEEAGRTALIKLADSGPVDVLPIDFNIRTRVHEYGGSCTAVDNSGNIYFTNFSDQNIYRLKPGKLPEKLTNVEKLRFANFSFDKTRNLLYAVMEDHRQSDLKPENSIVKICLNTGEITQLFKGYDFYAYPRINAQGDKLAFICWNHPQMPWDGTELWVAQLDSAGNPTSQKLVAGGEEESIVQPEWLNSALIFASDRTGWWNLYSYSNGQTESLYPMEAEFAKAMWSIGTTSYQVLSDTELFVTWSENCQWNAGILDLENKSLRRFNLPYNAFLSISLSERKVYFIGASFSILPEVVELDIDSANWNCIYKSGRMPLPAEYVSTPKEISFPVGNGESAYAFFYPPVNPDFEMPDNEKPPLLVISHGGPTGSAGSTLNLSIQFWTTRGFAVVDVNYGGSTGYGRRFRNRLRGNWGITDVKDCEYAAMHLAKQGLIDPDRIAIRGGSAGGFTTLAALTFTNTFKAGASYFGLSDLEALARETHKFESRYMDNLLGSYPENKSLYHERSPINSADKLSCPVIFFQGLDDRVVPPNQAEEMFKILKEKGIATAYVAYEGEGHGFRQAKNIKHALEAELYFFCTVFNLDCEIAKAPIEIHNL
ncbi:MAG: S9 family peptidase [Candidatus Rifleibacteriota bacterium]